MENEGLSPLLGYPGGSTLCCSTDLTSKAKTQPSPDTAASAEAPRAWNRQDNSRSTWLCCRPRHLHRAQTQHNHPSKSPGGSSAEFLLLGLADVYVSQTESRLLPTDELYQTDVNTAGEGMEAFLQGPERQRVQEL